MSVDQLILWIIIGAIAGFLADLVVKGTRVGLVGAIIVGIIGAFIGGWLFARLGVSLGGGLLSDILTAFVGAVVILLLLRVVRRL